MSKKPLTIEMTPEKLADLARTSIHACGSLQNALIDSHRGETERDFLMAATLHAMLMMHLRVSTACGCPRCMTELMNLGDNIYAALPSVIEEMKAQMDKGKK